MINRHRVNQGLVRKLECHTLEGWRHLLCGVPFIHKLPRCTFDIIQFFDSAT